MRIEDPSLNLDRAVVTTKQDASVASALALLTTHNIGALPVCDPAGAVVGILSERDIIHALPSPAFDLEQTPVNELMSQDVVTCAPGDDINDVMTAMDERRIRHIPVIAEGRLWRMVSSRDLMGALLQETNSHARTLTLAYEMVR